MAMRRMAMRCPMDCETVLLALWGGAWFKKKVYIAAHIEAITEAGTGVFVRPSGVVHTRGQRWQLEEHAVAALLGGAAWREAVRRQAE